MLLTLLIFIYSPYTVQEQMGELGFIRQIVQYGRLAENGKYVHIQAQKPSSINLIMLKKSNNKVLT